MDEEKGRRGGCESWLWSTDFLLERKCSNGVPVLVTYDGEREIKRVHPFPAVHDHSSFI